MQDAEKKGITGGAFHMLMILKGMGFSKNDAFGKKKREHMAPALQT
jgi:hypothetical protein